MYSLPIGVWLVVPAPESASVWQKKDFHQMTKKNRTKTEIIYKSHLGLLCDIGELNALFAGSANIEAFLQQIVDLMAKHIKADVCSIYLYNRENEELELKATRGLNPKSVNTTRLKLGEGLVGWAIQERIIICEKNASHNPHFKLIPNIQEEGFEAFLVVPILRGMERIGALVVQRQSEHEFTEGDEMALKAITAQLAGVIENSRLLIELHARHKEKEKPELDTAHDYRILKVEVASEGLAHTQATVIDEGKPYRFLTDYEYKNQYTLEDFIQAVKTTEKQLEDLQTQLETKVTGVASLIFGAHILMLKDTAFTGAMMKLINEGENPPIAIISVANRFIKKLALSPNPYTREKARDVEDLTRRLVNILVTDEESCHVAVDWHNKIVIARDLYPSDIMKLSAENISGIILVSGGITSHLSILARSLQIPMVIADDNELLNLPEYTSVILDAEMGNLHINPLPAIVKKFLERKRTRAKRKILKRLIKSETYTKDGVRIHLLANVNLMMDLKIAEDMNAEGIGLYRTEFPFMVKPDFPNEEEQVVVYNTIVNHMRDKPMYIRTLDIGGDKVLAYYNQHQENNPALGMRSIRFSLSHLPIFEEQLRAILRAGTHATNLRIIFPMISSVDEFLEAKKCVVNCIAKLEEENLPHNRSPKIGAMIETPSVIEIIDHLAKEADFFCIGTNDFIQFMLAVDRTNSLVSSYFLPHHPAILRGLAKIARAARAQGIDVSICGEIASQKLYVPFLLGIGIHTLSIDPRSIPRVQKIISSLSLTESEAIAKALLKQSTIAGVVEILQQK